jgi:hypothetical protein
MIVLVLRTPFNAVPIYFNVRKFGASISSKDIALSASVGVQEVSGKSKSS